MKEFILDISNPSKVFTVLSVIYNYLSMECRKQ